MKHEPALGGPTPVTELQQPDPPVAARDIFGDRLPVAEEYARLLGTEAIVRGLIGPREVPRLWDRHLLNCAVVAELIEADAEVIDVGSGAGLPGIPLAIARPDLAVLLVEPLHRRVEWLTDVVDRLGLDQVRVRRARAEDLHGEVTAATVTARAVAPMTRLAGWCLPLVAPGGSLLALKGQSAAADLAKAEAVIADLGGVECAVRVVGASRLADPTSVVQVRVGSDGPRTAPSRVARTGSGAVRPITRRRGEQ